MGSPKSRAIFYAPIPLAVFFAFADAAQAQTFKAPRLQVDIPGLTFSDITVAPDATKVNVPYLAQYINGIYTYLVGIAGIVAAVMAVIGGFQYLTAGGDAGRVKAAKERITNAIAGVLLTLGAYTLLHTVSPSLVALHGLDIKLTANKTVEFSGTDVGGETDDPTPDLASIKFPPGTTCPKSGGADAIGSIVDGMQGNVAYRQGGKGGPPPYKESKPENAKLNADCPSGKLCLDSSGFVRLALVCAGIDVPQGGSRALLSGPLTYQIKSYKINDDGTMTFNGQEIRKGDIFGRLGSETASHDGETYLYMGDGTFAALSVTDRDGISNPVRGRVTKEFLEQHVLHFRGLSPGQENPQGTAPEDVFTPVGP